MTDITQEQVDEILRKPKSQRTAADRVLLAKAKKVGLKVEEPKEAPSQKPLSPEQEMAQLLSKPRKDWTEQEKARFSELAKMGVKVKKPEAEAPPPDDPQAQARYLEQKPRSQWTAADRVLLSKLRKQDIQVKVEEEAPAAPPKEAAPAKPEVKPEEPQVMGPYLRLLYRMRTGVEEPKPEILREIETEAEALRSSVVEAMGKEDFSLEELAKKDITLRQRYERAMLMLEGLRKLKEPEPSKGALDGFARFWAHQKERLSQALQRRGVS